MKKTGYGYVIYGSENHYGKSISRREREREAGKLSSGCRGNLRSKVSFEGKTCYPCTNLVQTLEV